jgi:hypothetical protein
MPSYCATAAVPKYQHRLVWVFTWYSLCAGIGSVGGPVPTPFTCLNLLPFDATTGDESYVFQGGG